MLDLLSLAPPAVQRLCGAAAEIADLRRELEPYDAGHLIENERGLGYRLRTCP